MAQIRRSAILAPLLVALALPGAAMAAPPTGSRRAT